MCVVWLCVVCVVCVCGVCGVCVCGMLTRSTRACTARVGACMVRARVDAVCAHVCVCACMHVYVCACMRMRMCVCACMVCASVARVRAQRACGHAWCARARVDAVCARVCACVCVHACVRVCMHAHARVRVCAHGVLLTCPAGAWLCSCVAWLGPAMLLGVARWAPLRSAAAQCRCPVPTACVLRSI